MFPTWRYAQKSALRSHKGAGGQRSHGCRQLRAAPGAGACRAGQGLRAGVTGRVCEELSARSPAPPAGLPRADPRARRRGDGFTGSVRRRPGSWELPGGPYAGPAGARLSLGMTRIPPVLSQPGGGGTRVAGGCWEGVLRGCGTVGPRAATCSPPPAVGTRPPGRARARPAA